MSSRGVLEKRSLDCVRLPATFAAAGIAHACLIALAGATHVASVQPKSEETPIEAALEVASMERPDRAENISSLPRPAVLGLGVAGLQVRPALGRHRGAPPGAARSSEPPRSAAPAEAQTSAMDHLRSADTSTDLAVATEHELPPPGVGGDEAHSPRSAQDTRDVNTAARPGALPHAELGSNGLVARGPRLVPEPNPCRGVFPTNAGCDRAIVTVALDVTESGTPTTPQVLSEQPSGQGFANAARLCSASLRFYPASDGAGRPVAARSVVRLRFAR